MITPELLLQTIQYVCNAPYFWITMGMVTAIAMFVGAILFDGDLHLATKGIISLLSYLFFLLQAQITRVIDATQKNITHSPTYMYHAASVTIVILSLFWIFGVGFGVYISYMSRKHYKLIK